MHYAVDCGHSECVHIMLSYGADPGLRDKQGKNATDLSVSRQITQIIEEFNRSSIVAGGSPSPIGEVTTYVISEASDHNRRYETSPNIPMRCSVVSPVSEKSSQVHQLYPIFTWLEKYRLEDYYEVLIDAGYDDINIMINQMKGPLPLSDKNLREIGICKPGHRRLILVKLEDEAGLVQRDNKHVRVKSSGFLQCCVLSNSTRNFNPPKLMEWLEELELSHLYALFLESGYDSYETLLEIQNSLHPLTNRQLELEVKIKDNKARAKVLTRLEIDAKHFSEQSKAMFDEPKKIVCESCRVI